MAIFLNKEGKEVIVTESVDIKEWEKAGFKRQREKKKRVGQPKKTAPEKVQSPEPLGVSQNKTKKVTAEEI